jgi:hypothetical protein
MSDGDSDGIYEITVTLAANTQYEYKFVNGNAWGMDESVPTACAQNGNRFVDVGTNDIDLPTVCFASCGPCVGIYSVTFRVNMQDEVVSANGIHIAGNFQNWDPAATPMSDGNGDGIYEVTVQLNGNNTYQYKFINGNAWGDDESVPAECALNNNRFLDVGTMAVATDAFCFGSCDPCIVSTLDLTLNNSLVVHPNPSSGLVHLNFKSDLTGSVAVKCHNMLSQVILADEFSVVQGANTLSVQLPDNGVYMLTVESAKGIATRKVIIE